MVLHFSQQNLSYRITTVISWIFSFFVLVSNVVAIAYFSLKKTRMKRNTENRFKKFRFSVYSKHPSLTQSIYKPDEIIVLSLCSANLTVGIATAIDMGVFITENDIPVWLQSLIGYIVTFSILVSNIHILFLSLERLLSVRYPVQHQSLNNKQTFYMIFIVWVMSILPTLLNLRNLRRSAFSLLLAVLIIISYIILIITYSYILTKMDATFKRCYDNDDVVSIKRQKERDRRATFSCCSIVFSYIICTLIPVYKLITNKNGVAHDKGERIDITMFLFLLLRSISDPLVYILRNKIYDFGMLLCRVRRRHKKQDILNYDLSFSDEDEFMELLVYSKETCL